MSNRTSTVVAFTLKVVITLGLLFYILDKGRIEQVFTQIRTIDLTFLGGAALLTSLQLALSGLRWSLITDTLGNRLRVSRSLAVTFIGHFFNQVLPTALGGDAVRAWLASREGIALGPAIRGLLCDRMVGLVALMVIISITLLTAPGMYGNALPLVKVFRLSAVLLTIGCIALFFLGAPVAHLLMGHRYSAPVGRLLIDLRKVLYSPSRGASTMGLSGMAHGLAVGAILLCAVGMKIHLDLAGAFAVVPAIMLVSMAPVSIAGWGVREGAMIVGLGIVGISATDALAVSVTYGILQILVGLIGGALWLAERSEVKGRPRGSL